MERYIVTNLERALKILELIATKKEGSTITEIANSLGFPKNSVFRIMRTLEANGYLTEKERRYHFSPKLISLGYAGIESTNLVSAALDAMHVLRDEINETVFIGCLSEYQKVVILEELPSYQYVKFTIEVGHMVPIHASAPGKAILSFMPEKEQEDMLNHIRFRRYNDRTIPSKRAMLAEIEKVHSKGFALDLGEEVSELYCVASPILDYRGYPIASLWISGPAFRLSKMDLDEVGGIVKAQSMEVSKSFGFEPELRKALNGESLEQ